MIKYVIVKLGILKNKMSLSAKTVIKTVKLGLFI